MAKSKNTPKLRFPEFSGEWIEKKLEEVFKDFIVPMRDKPKKFSGKIPWTRIEDIEGKYLNDSKSGQYVSEETISKMNLKIIPKNSLIVSASATFGVVAVVTNDLITNQTFIGLVPNEKYDLNYLYNLFKSPEIQKKMYLESAGSTIFYISRDKFEKMVSKFPELPEQEKIANFFANVDRKISLLEDKLDLFNDFKKFCMQQLFAQKLRFKNENGENYPYWEEKKLGDLIKYYNGLGFPSKYQGFLNRKYKFFKVSDMNLLGNEKYMEYVNNTISDDVLTNLKGILAPKKSIIFPKLGAALLTNKRRILTEDSLFDNNILGIKAKNNLNDEFLYFFMLLIDFSRYVQVGAIPSISKKIVDDIKIKIPSIEEQEKIANFLLNIDNKIDKITIELTNMKEFKKGLLQQMFI